MRSAFIILPGILLTLSACGRGGATLETDNVQAEWFPKGSRTAIVLEHETAITPERGGQYASATITLFYTSHGNDQGTISVNGASPETASVSYEHANKNGNVRFETSSREIRLHQIHPVSSNEQAATLSGWSYQERGTLQPRTGQGGTLITEPPVQ